MPIVIIFTIFVVFSINIIVEFGVVYLFFRSSGLIKKDLFLSIILVNLVVFTPTFTIFYFLLMFYIELIVLYNIFIGILMILVEWLLYRLEFQKLLQQQSIHKNLSLKKIIIISTLANIASYSVIYLYPTIMMFQQYLQFPELYNFSLFYCIKLL
ncbi:MAG: hypothetical protein KAW51_08935 [Candidatus Lokiarchaeota archaeon]|nr:hypothetical protein [Candidatus Lokiarchaeota archaeon]